MAASAAIPDDFVSGLEGVVAFTSDIAEPDKDGGALRYRGVDIEDLVGQRRHLRQRVGPARRRPLRPRPPAGRAVPPPHPHRRRPRRRAGRPGDARSHLGIPAAPRHRRRDRPRQARPRLGHGTVLRRAVRSRHLPARRPPEPHRRGQDRHRALHGPLEGRARPRTRRGHRRLLGLGRRARHERLHLHRPRHRLHRRRRRRLAFPAPSARCPARCTAAHRPACCR